MFRKLLSVMLVSLLLNAVAVDSTYARCQDEQTRDIEKVNENVRKLGVGREARVEVQLKDGRKLKGYIHEASESSFTVIDVKSGTATSLDYSQVKQLKGSNRLTAAKVGLNIVKGVAIVGAVAAGFTLIALIFVPKT